MILVAQTVGLFIELLAYSLWKCFLFLLRLFGFASFYSKLFPTKENPYQSGILWMIKWALTIGPFLVGLYSGSFYLASQLYQNRIDIIENRANAIFPLLGIRNPPVQESTDQDINSKTKATNSTTPDNKNILKKKVSDKKDTLSVRNAALAKIPGIQNMQAPQKPLFWDYRSIYDSLLSVCDYHEAEEKRRENRKGEHDPSWFKWIDKILDKWVEVKQKERLQTECKPYVEIVDQLRETIEILKDDLNYVNLGGADLQGANLIYANLQRTKLQVANLRKADLGGADLQGAFLQKANLEDANLQWAKLLGARLTGANLEGANLEEAYHLSCGQVNSVKSLDSNTKFPKYLEVKIINQNKWTCDYVGKKN
jgi:hypothetical protein